MATKMARPEMAVLIAMAAPMTAVMAAGIMAVIWLAGGLLHQGEVVSTLFFFLWSYWGVRRDTLNVRRHPDSDKRWHVIILADSSTFYLSQVPLQRIAQCLQQKCEI